MSEQYIQEPLIEVPVEEKAGDVVIGGYKMTWVKGHWRRSAMKRHDKETE